MRLLALLLLTWGLLTGCSAESSAAWQTQDSLEAVDGGTWVVGNHLVTVAPDASVSGTPAIGATVQVSGRRTGQGELVADHVEVLSAPAGPTRQPQVQPVPPPAQPAPARVAPARGKKSGHGD